MAYLSLPNFCLRNFNNALTTYNLQLLKDFLQNNGKTINIFFCKRFRRVYFQIVLSNSQGQKV